jgi:hypothetical protein
MGAHILSIVDGEKSQDNDTERERGTRDTHSLSTVEERTRQETLDTQRKRDSEGHHEPPTVARKGKVRSEHQKKNLSEQGATYKLPSGEGVAS